MPTIEVNERGEAAERHEIIPSISIDTLLQQRASVMRLFSEALNALVEAQTIADAAHLGFPDVSVGRHFRANGLHMTGPYSRTPEILELVQAVVDAGAWRYLMDESGMRSLMSATKREAFDKQLAADKVPELSREAIYDTFTALHASRGAMFEQGVIECYKRLSWCYKTNNAGPMKFGKRIVMTYLTSYGSPNHRSTSELDDLMRVFHILDGKPEADHRQGCYALIAAAMQDQPAWPKHAENDYISVRLFKNQNGHVTFKRPELIEQLNRIIIKHFPNVLPAPH
jgi:hypothetical protein